jgi:glutamine amidotransferase
MVTIIDYGVGNLASIQNMLKKAGHDSMISSNKRKILAADKLILPGVGAFDTCAGRLKESGLTQILNEKVIQEKTPVLGICVGFQLLTWGSEEGKLPGLGWINGQVVKFKNDALSVGLKIPHMGWTDVLLNKPSKLFLDMFDNPRFYFVHSYYPELINENDTLLYADYGQRFVAAAEFENIMGVQFHPEKSHKYGMRLLENFVRYY